MKKTSMPDVAQDGDPGVSPVAEAIPEDRVERIAVAAYYRSQARGFAPGREIDDWLAAEAELDRAAGG